MNRTLLNEHDANQGAQSRGEFLGMTANSGWYLLGSIAASLLIVILCWGMLGISLLLCLLVGVMLCGLSVAYVFALKNNRPEHYDTDFFEAALIEAGVVEMTFGPRQRRIANPFSTTVEPSAIETRRAPEQRNALAQRRTASSSARRPEQPLRETPAVASAAERKVRRVSEPVVPLASYEHLREELDFAEEMLEDALTERTEG
jgi:hypothetical protein